MKVKKLALLLWLALVLLPAFTGCERESPPPPAARTPVPEKPGSKLQESSENITLQTSASGGVLILEEGEDQKKSPPGGDDGLSGRKPPPADYPAFRDQHVKIYAAEVDPALNRAVQLAATSGAQVIDYPIKGFENMGPNEKTLVFDYRTFRPYLKKIGSLGRIEHPEIERSDYVTVRLTVLPVSAGD